VIFGTAKRPRLSVFRSDKHILAQLIDDEKGVTLVSVSDLHLGKEESEKAKKDRSFLVGRVLAERAKEKKIKSVVFDRGGNLYHGRVKSLAEGAREGGLSF
jgi:large subunit ribosomal protein L18